MFARFLFGLLGVLITLCLALGIYALWLRQEITPETKPGRIEATTTIPDEPAAVDSTEDFLDAFEHSFVGPYTVVGTLEFANDQASTRSIVRRARLGDKSLDQIGGGAVVTRNGNERRCSDDGTQFLCTDPEPEPTLAGRRAEMRDLIQSGTGYEVTTESDSCYVLTAYGDGSFSPLGEQTTYCFDSQTGAVSSRVTLKGKRTESFIASEIRNTVTEDDLAPA